MIRPGVLLRMGALGVYVQAPAGCGKSSAALALLQEGRAQLVSDDAVCLRACGGQLMGRAPQSIAGLLYVRGRGLVHVAERFGPAALVPDSPVHLLVQVQRREETQPWVWDTCTLGGICLRRVWIYPALQEDLAPLLLRAAETLQKEPQWAAMPPDGG